MTIIFQLLGKKLATFILNHPFTVFKKVNKKIDNPDHFLKMIRPDNRYRNRKRKRTRALVPVLVMKAEESIAAACLAVK